MRKKLKLLLLAFCILVVGVPKNVRAQEEDTKYKIVENIVVEEIKEGFSQFYSVENYSVEMIHTEENEKQAEIYMFVSMDMLLKIQDVSELPYIKGMLEKVNLNNNSKIKSILKSSDLEKCIKDENIDVLTDTQASVVAQEISLIAESVEKYVGNTSDTNFYLKVVVDLDDDLILADDVHIYVENAEGEYEFIENIYPKSEDKMVDEAEEFVEYCIENADEMKMRNKSSNDIASRVARGTSAVNYMLQYTSNPTKCDCNVSSCTAKQDKSKWNEKAYPYSSTYLHKDCADYVSQALYESGISTSGNWTKRSSTWSSASKLVNYMVDRGIFIKASSSEPITGGSVVYMPGHIVMITYADTISLKYSAHTHDRRNVVYSSNSSYTEYNLW